MTWDKKIVRLRVNGESIGCFGFSENLQTKYYIMIELAMNYLECA